MKNRITTSENTQQRRCDCTMHNGSCVTCSQDCPFPYCQHEDCMACENRARCPMCQGECKMCEVKGICKILQIVGRG